MVIVNILKCSTKGDVRYSALHAKVSIFGKEDTVQNHYQLSSCILTVAPRAGAWIETEIGKKKDNNKCSVIYTEAGISRLSRPAKVVPPRGAGWVSHKTAKAA